MDARTRLSNRKLKLIEELCIRAIARDMLVDPGDILEIICEETKK